MHRVELKDWFDVLVDVWRMQFLMHRVELKGDSADSLTGNSK